jgi:hypothetical protein
MKLTTICMLTLIPLLSTTGCKDKKDDKGGGKSAGKPAAGAKVDYAALTADPDPGAITPAEKPPFESVQFQKTGKRNSKGWPEYNAYNLSTKPIKYVAISVYGYDKDGKQVIRTSPPLSWNGNIAPGGKTDWEISVGDFGDPIPSSAVTFDVCWDSIQLEGAETVSDTSRCPDNKAHS